MVQRKWVDISKPTQMAHIHLVEGPMQIKVVPKCRKAKVAGKMSSKKESIRC
jgi:hypothetical protein